MHRGWNVTVSCVVTKIGTRSLSTGIRDSPRVTQSIHLYSKYSFRRDFIPPVNSYRKWKLIETTASPFIDGTIGRNVSIESLILSLYIDRNGLLSAERGKEITHRPLAARPSSNGKDLYLSCPFKVRDPSRCPSSSTACLLTVYTTQSPLFVETLEAAKVCGYLYNVESSLRSIFVIRLSHREILNRGRDSLRVDRMADSLSVCPVLVLKRERSFEFVDHLKNVCVSQHYIIYRNIIIIFDKRVGLFAPITPSDYF